MEYREFIKVSLSAAAAIARRNFGKLTSSTTKPEDPTQVLTQTDLDISKFLVSKISALYPPHNLIDEEAGVVNHSSAYTWVIDPIDGTSNFAAGVPLYGIKLGLLKGGNPIAGGISLPSFNELYLAEKNQGAYVNGKSVRVTEEINLIKVLVAYGIDGSHDDSEFNVSEGRFIAKLVAEILNLRTSNSCYDEMQVAKGTYGAWLTQKCKIWDIVAQQIIVEEAGGWFTDFSGKPLDYTYPLTKFKQNFTVCAAAPALHSELQKIIHRKS